MLPKGLKLFMAEIIDENTNNETFWYVVGRTYNSAFNRFVKEANKTWYRYDYYFYEVEDEEAIENFMEEHESIKADVYECLKDIL